MRQFLFQQRMVPVPQEQTRNRPCWWNSDVISLAPVYGHQELAGLAVHFENEIGFKLEKPIDLMHTI